MRPCLPTFAALLLPLLLLAGCGSGTDEAPPFRVEAVGDTASTVVAEATGLGLTARDATGAVVPGVARSWRVFDDGRSIVFRLRELRFAGGATVTAADVARSIERARRSPRPVEPGGPPLAQLLAGVERVAAPLDTVVELRLTTPQPEILELLATPALAVIPRRGAAGLGAFTTRNLPPAGPGEPPLTELTRNPGFFAAETVSLPAVTVRPSAADPAIARFNRGESELVLGGGLEGLGSARVTARGRNLLLERPRAALLILVNQKRGLLADPGVRRALQLAVNREVLGPALFGTPVAGPVYALVPRTLASYPGGPVPDWSARPLIARQEEARTLLLEAGVDPLQARLKLPVAVTDLASDARLMALVATDLAQVGVDIALVRRTAPAHAEAVAAGEFELALVRHRTPYDSPLPFLLPFQCAANRHGVCLPEADRLLAEAWAARSLAGRLGAFAAAERLWAEDGAAIGLVQPLSWSLVASRVEGFEPNSSAVHALRHLSLAPDRRLLP